MHRVQQEADPRCRAGGQPQCRGPAIRGSARRGRHGDRRMSSSAHRSGQAPASSTRDGETWTACPAAFKGARVVGGSSPAQSRGSAPATPARASTASRRASARSSAVGSSDPPAARSASARSVATRPRRSRRAKEPGRSTASPRAEGSRWSATWSKNTEGRMSSSRTAVTTTRRVAREIAETNIRRSSATTSFRAVTWSRGSENPIRPSSTSARWPAPRSVSRSRVSGQAPSCSPGTTTRSHSRPAASATVSTCTPSCRCPIAARVSLGSDSDRTLSTNSMGRDRAVRSAKFAAAAKSAITASRSLSARSPKAPPATARCCQTRSSPVACHAAHSTDS